MKEINIWWEGPFSKSQIINNKIDSAKYNNTSNRIGLYQIYGTHPLYGNDVLLYIGRTKSKKGFADRLNQRWEIEGGNDDENVKIYLGTIYSSEVTITQAEENSLIDLSEVLLINALKPAFNSSNIKSVGKKYLENSYRVHNENNYRNLYPILSSEYFLQSTIGNENVTEILAKEYNADIKNKDTFYMFTLPSNENILIGIDYECWEQTKKPLHLAILKEGINKSIIKQLKKKFDFLNYEDDDEECIYISLADNLKDENVIKEIKEKISDIERVIIS